MMGVVASIIFLLAATSTPPLDAPVQPPTPTAFPSEDALLHYAQGRLLEERGQTQDAMAEYYRAMFLDHRGAGVARRLSELAARQGESARSLEFADRSLGLDPGNARGLWLKGAALFNLGRAGESIDFLKQAAWADSDRIEYLKTLARVAEQLDRIDLVAWAYERTVQLDSEDGEAWFQLAAAQARRRQFELAGKSLAQASELNPARPGILFLRGWVAEGLGRPDDAIRLYQQHLEIHTGDQVTRRRLVNLLGRQRRYDEAFREAQNISRATPGDIGVLEVETDLAFRSKHSSEGRKLLQELQTQAESDPDMVLRVVGLMARNDQEKAALAYADAWAGRHPGSQGLMLTARARALVGQSAAGIELARRAVEAEPDSIEARILLARLYQADRRYQDAARIWAEVSSRNPDDTDVLLDLAFCREQLGDLTGAQAAAREVLKRSPENATALNFLGYLLADHRQDLGEAMQLIQRAVDQDPDNGAYIDSLGWIYYRLGRLADARVQLERAVHLTNGDPVVHEHLGDVYKDMRLFELARQEYRKSLDRDASNGRVRAKLSEIR